MRVQVHEICKECRKPVVVTLTHTPEPRATFWFHCPHCYEPNLARFDQFVPEGRVLNTVMGMLAMQEGNHAHHH